MQSAFEDVMTKLNAKELWDFPGGIKPEQHKQLSNQTPIDKLPLPERLYVPLKQHIGLEGHVCVEPGQHVLKGQPLTKSMNPFAVPVHAPTSGTIINIAPHVAAHPSGLPELSIEIASDQQDQWIPLQPMPDYQQRGKMAILGAICDAGISGMGGAGFPTHIKSSPKKTVEFLIINGIECEPYISADDRLMREHAWQIRQGIDVLCHLLEPQAVLIGIEDNKPEAIEAMNVACRENPRYQICSIPTKYPAGGEKQLIQVLTNREVPSSGLPIDVGIIMHNVGTCFAIADAIFSGKPLIERVVTVTGQAVHKRGNYWALIGTPVAHLLAHSDYKAIKQKHPVTIMGGPMMGFTLRNNDVPVVKTTNCILVPADRELGGSITGDKEQPCIRCGACADACPASLLPQQLLWHAKAKELDKAQDYHLFDCIECGACAYVCPSEIPLVHYYRIAKADVRIEQQEKQKSDKARERFERRAKRLLDEQQAREEKHRVAAKARKQAMAQQGNDAKDKIAAALARAKAKKAQLADNTEQNTTANQAKSAAVTQANTPEQQPSDTPSTLQGSADDRLATGASANDRVQAAIARAKAKKASAALANDKLNAEATLPASGTNAPSSQNIETPLPTESASARKPSAVQAASAEKSKEKPKNRVDASKNTNRVENEGIADEALPKASVSNPLDEKQQKIASAVAKAKAKRLNNASKAESSQTKAAKPDTDENKAESVRAAEQIDSSEDDTQSDALNAKKQQIAAAVAKAKAKKAAQAAEKGE